MVGKNSKSGTIENDGGPERSLRAFQFPNDLKKQDPRVLFFQNVLEVNFDCFQIVNQCPGSASRLEEHVVEFVPWCVHDHQFGSGSGLAGSGIACQVGIQTGLSDAGGESLGQTTQSLAYDLQPLGQIVSAGEKLGICSRNFCRS